MVDSKNRQIPGRSLNGTYIYTVILGHGDKRVWLKPNVLGSINVWRFITSKTDYKIVIISTTVHRSKRSVYNFCAARREESNGLCSRSIRPIVFELWRKISIWPLTCGTKLPIYRKRCVGRKKITGNDFVQLAERNPMVFVTGTYDQ